MLIWFQLKAKGCGLFISMFNFVSGKCANFYKFLKILETLYSTKIYPKYYLWRMRFEKQATKFQNSHITMGFFLWEKGEIVNGFTPRKQFIWSVLIWVSSWDEKGTEITLENALRLPEMGCCWSSSNWWKCVLDKSFSTWFVHHEQMSRKNKPFHERWVDIFWV